MEDQIDCKQLLVIQIRGSEPLATSLGTDKSGLVETPSRLKEILLETSCDKDPLEVSIQRADHSASVCGLCPRDGMKSLPKKYLYF